MRRYERTCPVSNGTCRGDASAGPGAPVHVTVGSGGIDYDRGVWNATSWSVVHYDPAWGFGTLRVENRSHLGWAFTYVAAANAENNNNDGAAAAASASSVRDQVWITQRVA